MDNSMRLAAWLAVGMAGCVSLIAPFFLRPVLERHGIVDRPNERSSHVDPTLRGGGIAPLMGFALACALLASSVDGQARSVIVTISITGVLAGLLGLVEDTYGLSVVARATAQLLLGLGAAAFLGLIFTSHWGQIAVGAVAVMVYVNVANFMDGINGISGLHGLVVGTAYSSFGLLTQTTWLVLLGLVVATAYAAFLPWNLRMPGIFLGDVGSYLLGAAIASLGMAAWFAGFNSLIVLAPVAIYLADTVTTIARRASRQEPILRSHRSHFYQRLTDTGLSHLQVAVIVTLFSVATSLCGLATLCGWISSWLAFLLVGGICAAYLALPRVRGHHLPPRSMSRLAHFELPPPSPARPDFAPTRFAVVGPSGFVGSALVEELEGEGRAVERIRAPRLMLDPTYSSGVTVAELAARHSELDALAAQLHGVEVVVNAAGLATPDAPPSEELYGANALLPALVLCAAGQADVSRVIHLSSAAVQGRRPVLDGTSEVAPFSPYSRSKALGESAFLSAAGVDEGTDAIILRATSVQGPGRRTTASLRRVARSALASVGGSGEQPTVVSSIDGLTDAIRQISVSTQSLDPILLQPWEGLSVADVMRAAGGREPRHLPRWLCQFVLFVARSAGNVIPEIAGTARRLELMWLGQRQIAGEDEHLSALPQGQLRSLLASQSPGVYERRLWRRHHLA